MTTFVLVHGSWHGGWCWKYVAPRLRALGHEVTTPTLTGLGERSHLARRDHDFSVHVEDLVAHVTYEDLRDIVLVGHSYGGWVITAAAERIADRIRRLVYLDAWVPDDGESIRGLIGPEGMAEFERRAAGFDGWRSPAPSPSQFGVTDPAQQAWMESRLVPGALKIIEGTVSLSDPAAARLPRSYIRCTRALPAFELFVERFRRRGWPVALLDAGHDAMVTHPDELVALIREAPSVV